GTSFADDPATLASFSLRDSAHDGVQLHVARHAGSLPNLPAKTVWSRRFASEERKRHLQPRSHFWGYDFWRALANLGSSSLDHRGCNARDCAYSRLDVFPLAGNVD